MLFGGKGFQPRHLCLVQLRKLSPLFTLLGLSFFFEMGRMLSTLQGQCKDK